jgi:hypothetical protein
MLGIHFRTSAAVRNDSFPISIWLYTIVPILGAQLSSPLNRLELDLDNFLLSQSDASHNRFNSVKFFSAFLAIEVLKNKRIFAIKIEIQNYLNNEQFRFIVDL